MKKVLFLVLSIFSLFVTKAQIDTATSGNYYKNHEGKWVKYKPINPVKDTIPPKGWPQRPKLKKDSSKKLFQKVTVGAVLGMIASTDFSKNEKPFTIGYNLSPNVTVITPRTYHNMLYGFGNNSFRSLNGYFLPKSWDTYLLYSKILHTGNNYLGWGIEKMTKIENKGEGIKCFLFGEFGTNFTRKKFLSFGLLISIQHKIWKRE